ncbi:MAG: methyl-accepting chemotaxis protein [Chloroflexota bacterium]
MEKRTSLFSRLMEWGPIAWVLGRIRYKLLIAFMTVSLIPLIILVAISFISASNALNEKAFDHLRTVQKAKSSQLEQWLADRRGDILFVRNMGQVKGSEDINVGIPVLSLYKHNPSNPAFQEAFNRADSVLRPFSLEIGGGIYDDIMLIDADGDVVFTLYEDEMDGYEGNTVEFINGLKGVYVSDIEYKSGGNELVLSITAPVLDDDGATVGVIMMKASAAVLAEIMADRVGLGDSGEIYLVGQDNLWRSSSRYLPELGEETAVLFPDFTLTMASRSALIGNPGAVIVDNYLGIPVLSSWSSIVVQEPTEDDPDGIAWGLLTEIDQAEIQKPVLQMGYLIGGLLLTALVIVILAAYTLSGGLTRQANNIMRVFGDIGMGDFDARVDITSQDEIGSMATSLNAMLDNTLDLIQSREERDNMQSSIMKLLNEVSDVAEGDLTVEAEVTADMTGAIADAFNFMIVELRRVIHDVQDATLKVSTSSNEIQTAAEYLAKGSISQSLQIAETASAVDDMAVSIQQVSDNAALSATVGQQAVANAKQGTNAVQNTIEGMNRIRDQVQETSKRIKRLGESSQEIGEILELINEITDRTSILALNASIQAAMAGEAGRGFAVVAEEVERLAERSTEATKEIESLIRAIQGETAEAVAAMETTTREVVEGSLLANEAGQALSEIESVSNRLGELIQSISLASRQQARGSEVLAKSMDEISSVTSQTAAGTKQTAVSISNLAVLADNLRGSVSTFKLSSDGRDSQS